MRWALFYSVIINPYNLHLSHFCLCILIKQLQKTKPFPVSEAIEEFYN